jgi:hypothetical protein
VRDSKVMLDTVNALLARKGARSRRLVLDALRGRLQQRHAAARSDLTAGRRAASTANALTRASRRIGRAGVPKRGASALSLGVERIYRSARKALRAAEREPSTARLHEYMLEEHIPSAEASTHASFGDELGRRRRELEKRALKESRKLLRRKPRSVARRLTHA